MITSIISSLAIALMIGAAPVAAPAPVVDDAKVVVSLTTGDLDVLQSRIVSGLPTLASYYRAQGRGFHAVVVVHGEAYRYFLKDLAGTPYKDDAALVQRRKEVHAALDNLAREYGVRFEICSAGMKKRGLALDNVVSFATPIPNANIGLIDWQQRGYAYLPVGP